MDFIVNESMYLHELAYFSDLYLDTKYNNFTCILNQPLGTTAGSAIPANFPWPSYPLDSQKVVNIHGDPHVYAVDQVDVNFEISTGRLIASQVCDVTGCRNLAIPGTTKCSRH